MTFDEIIHTAMELETRVGDIYAEAAEICSNSAVRRIFETLRDDERYHLLYLKQRLEEWEKSGDITLEPIKSVVPTSAKLRSHAKKLKQIITRNDHELIRGKLSQALQAEIETSNYYKEMVSRSSETTQKMFARFLEIENAHIDAVRYELDYHLKTGYWFDLKEFDME
jgi:rubrerythrin